LIQVTIVSPNPSLRLGLRQMLNGRGDIQVVGEATALENINEEETEVIVLASVSLARVSLEGLQSAILFLTDDADALRTLAGLSGHVWGLLPADALEEEIAAGARRELRKRPRSHH